jgi:hypothetical protein
MILWSANRSGRALWLCSLGLAAMMRYQVELDLSFLLEPVTDEERNMVMEKGARRFD